MIVGGIIICVFSISIWKSSNNAKSGARNSPIPKIDTGASISRQQK